MLPKRIMATRHWRVLRTSLSAPWYATTRRAAPKDPAHASVHGISVPFRLRCVGLANRQRLAGFDELESIREAEHIEGLARILLRLGEVRPAFVMNGHDRRAAECRGGFDGIVCAHREQEWRIERVQARLRTSRKSLEQILAEVGVSEVASFRRVFRRELGYSPAEYRRRLRAPKEHGLRKESRSAQALLGRAVVNSG